MTLALRFQRLPELVLEQTQATVVHRVSTRTLSPVNAHTQAGAWLIVVFGVWMRFFSLLAFFCHPSFLISISHHQTT